MVADKHVIDFSRGDQREERAREFDKKIRGQQVVRLDIYIGSPARYKDIVAKLRTLATEIESTHAITREAGFEDDDIVGLVRRKMWAKRQEFAEMEPVATIKRAGVPNSKYRRK